MSFVELETDSRASPGAVSAGRTAAKRVSVQQSRPAWQPDGFRCSDCGRSGPGFPVLAVRVPKRRGQIALSVVFTTKYAGKPSARRGRWGVGCTETRFAANGPAITAPKRVFLPLGVPALHRNPFSRRKGRKSRRSSGAGPRDWPHPSPRPRPRAPRAPRSRPAPPRPRLFRLFRFPANLCHAPA